MKPPTKIITLAALCLFTKLLQAQPDLTLANGTFTYNSPTHELNITIDVKNIGLGDVGFGTGARAGCFLSTDAVVSADDYLITSFNLSYGIFGGACYCSSSTGNIDLTTAVQAPSGTYHVLVKADDTNVITESNENNNAADLGTLAYTATGIWDFSGRAVDAAVLEQNYPNPFITNTTFSFYVHEQGSISLKIYDAVGKEISTVIDQELKSGTYKYEFNPEKIGTGIYYYTLISNKSTQTRKLIKLKQP
ncbi:MAG: T9SS type A sorting domain-containing protein [Bacteroidetes bacterium]|nr:T9SS type A sorting domain-containing protein [Bacteroidota bacterium]